MHINNLSFLVFFWVFRLSLFQKKKKRITISNHQRWEFAVFRRLPFIDFWQKHSAALFSRHKVWQRTSHCLGWVKSLWISLGYTNWVSVGPLGAVPPCPAPLARRIQTVSFATWGLENAMSSCFMLVLALSFSRTSSGTQTPSFHFSPTLSQRGLATGLCALSPVPPWRGKLWCIPSAEIVCIHEVSSWCEWTDGMIGIRYGPRDLFPGEMEQGFLGGDHGWEGWVDWKVSRCRVPSGFIIFLRKETKKMKRMEQNSAFTIDCSVGRQKDAHPSITNQSCSFEKRKSFERVNERIAIWETKLLPSMLLQQR